MSQPTEPARAAVHTRHVVVVNAPAQEVFKTVADVKRWPYTFGPTVYAEVLDSTGDAERLRLWAFANGEVRMWTSRRVLDPESLQVAFEQEVPAIPVRSMGGEWRLEPLTDNTTRVELLHDFTAASAEAEELIGRAVETNSTAELAALGRTAERGSAGAAEVLEFEDSVDINASADAVYGFLRDAASWPRRLPHVARLDLTEEPNGVQLMVMDTRSTDGSLHTTKSVRVCLPERWTIAYKQTVTPPIMAAHVGRWMVVPHGPGIRATSHHTVVIRPEKVTGVLGPDGTLEQARTLIRSVLGANSTTTLRHAKTFAEANSSVA